LYSRRTWRNLKKDPGRITTDGVVPAPLRPPPDHLDPNGYRNRKSYYGKGDGHYDRKDQGASFKPETFEFTGPDS
jgi:hypothetical protein